MVISTAVSYYFNDARFDRKATVINAIKKQLKSVTPESRFLVSFVLMTASLHAIVLFITKVAMYVGKSLEDQDFKLTLIFVDNLFLRQIKDAGDTWLVIQESQCFQTTGLLEPFSKKCDIYCNKSYGCINYATSHKGLQ